MNPEKHGKHIDLNDFDYCFKCWKEMNIWVLCEKEEIEKSDGRENEDHNWLA